MKFAKLLTFVCISLTFLTIPVCAADVTLAWDPSPTQGVTGYRLYYGTSSGTYNKNVDVKNVTTYKLTGLQDGVTYYFVVKAYNADSESAPSNEVAKPFDLPAPAPPSNLKIVAVQVNSDGTAEMRLLDPKDLLALVK